MSRRSEWSYYSAVDEIYHAKWTARTELSKSVFRDALEHFWPHPKGHPTKMIQVAGTSGKGSTCQFLQAGLSLFGRAGCYVKPHVFDYSERFIVNNEQVDHSEILEVWEKDVRPYCASSAVRGETQLLDHPQTSLLIALRLFQKRKVEWAAVETGIGGRYDPVSSLDVVATVLTNVGRDHEDVLGSEHWQRALDKAGMCRPGVPLIVGDDDKRTLEVVSAVCRDFGAPLITVTPGDLEKTSAALGTKGKMVESPIESRHQLQNAAVAARTIGVLVKGTNLRALCRRFLTTRYVGRFWKIGPGVYADVAHNPSKTGALSEEIGRRFPNERKVFVVGISGNRDAIEVLGPLASQAKAFVVTAAGYKGQDPRRVASAIGRKYPDIPVRLVIDPRDTLNIAKDLATGKETIIFTGSTYMIDQALNPDERLRHLNGSYGWRESASQGGASR
ncbi:MAG: hypothetical protein HY296_06035 [Thaumarchaeota archaeon]|nr:hypothetical protein [Nitrososphaerota archaeon]